VTLAVALAALSVRAYIAGRMSHAGDRASIRSGELKLSL
jgi:hypothetical protein